MHLSDGGLASGRLVRGVTMEPFTAIILQQTPVTLFHTLLLAYAMIAEDLTTEPFTAIIAQRTTVTLGTTTRQRTFRLACIHLVIDLANELFTAILAQRAMAALFLTRRRGRGPERICTATVQQQLHEYESRWFRRHLARCPCLLPPCVM